MEEERYILVGKKDKKFLDQLDKSLSVIGLSIKDIKSLVVENKALHEEINLIKEEHARERKEIDAYIADKMKEIQVNVSKETNESNEAIKKQIGTFLHKGAKIDEKY